MYVCMYVCTQCLCARRLYTYASIHIHKCMCTHTLYVPFSFALQLFTLFSHSRLPYVYAHLRDFKHIHTCMFHILNIFICDTHLMCITYTHVYMCVAHMCVCDTHMCVTHMCVCDTHMCVTHMCVCDTHMCVTHMCVCDTHLMCITCTHVYMMCRAPLDSCAPQTHMCMTHMCLTHMCLTHMSHMNM